MQPSDMRREPGESTRFEPPVPEYDELVAYRAFADRRLHRLEARQARSRTVEGCAGDLRQRRPRVVA